MRSACVAPMTFGVISENTRIRNVTATVAMASGHSPSPNRRIVMTVASVVEPALIRLLPNRMTPSSRSVSPSSASASLAPRLPRCARCFSRKRLAAIIAVSAIEKNPEQTSRTASAMPSVPSENSSKGSGGSVDAEPILRGAAQTLSNRRVQRPSRISTTNLLPR